MARRSNPTKGTTGSSTERPQAQQADERPRYPALPPEVKALRAHLLSMATPGVPVKDAEANSVIKWASNGEFETWPQIARETVAATELLAVLQSCRRTLPQILTDVRAGRLRTGDAAHMTTTQSN